MSILNFAPEKPLRCFFQSLSGSQYISTDLNHPNVDVLSDICLLPFRDSRFDLIVINHVMEHIVDDHAAIAQLFRILKPGGSTILTFPYHSHQKTIEDPAIIDPNERRRHFGQWNHVRLIGNDYVERFRAAGFTTHAVPFKPQLPVSVRIRHGLRGSSFLFRCDKPDQ